MGSKWSKNRMVAAGVSLFAVALGAIVLFLVFHRTEYKVSVKEDGISVGVVYCKADSLSNPFFDPIGADKHLHEIKITFDNRGADKILYSYYGSYSNESAAEEASARMHADYNIYLSGYNVDYESLYPTFSPVENEVRINLYADEKTFNTATAKLFYLDESESIDFYDYTSDELLKMYETKGFHCSYKK